MLLSFSQFMNEALYANDGYYEKQNKKIGVEGDFITSANFGMILPSVVSQYICKKMKDKKTAPLIIEIGAGTGKISSVIWDLVSKEIDNLEYILVEASDYHRSLLKEKFKSIHSISIYSSIEALRNEKPAISSAIVFMNELLDAIPTEVVKKERDSFLQLYVKKDEDRWVEEWYEPTAEVNSYVKRYHFLECEENHRIEINVQMSNFLQTLFTMLKNGTVICVDYGYDTKEKLQSSVKNGTLRGYFRHQLIKDIYTNVKHMDITYHIHWDEFFYQAKKQQYKEAAFTTQEQFLIENGILNLLKETKETDPFHPDNKWNRHIHSILLGSGISQALQVAIVEK